MKLGLESRNGVALWDNAIANGWDRSALDSPLYRELKVHFGDRCSGLERQWPRLQTRIEETLRRPAGLGQGRRALRGAIAVAATDTALADAMVVARLDRLSHLLFALAAWQKGVAEQGRSILTIPAQRTWYAMAAGDFLVCATKRERLFAFSTDTPRAWVAPEPAPGASLMVALRDCRSLQKRLPGRFKSMESAGLQCRLVEGQLQLEMVAEGRIHNRLLPAEPVLAKGAALIPPKDAICWASGQMAPGPAWRSQMLSLWPEEGRPLRGVNQPMSVLAWQWLDKGVIAGADGRFSISLCPPHVLPTPSPVPVAPCLQAQWGVVPEKQAVCSTAFHKGLEEMVAFYSAPGGSELYEKVRAQTRFQPAKDGRGEVKLHPLFFNHMAVAWRFPPGEPAIAVFSTAPTDLTPRTAAPVAHRKAYADFSFGWSFDAKARQSLRTIVHEKVVRHGFVAEEETQQAVMAGLDLFLSAAETVPQGQGTVRLVRKQALSRKGPRWQFSLHVTGP